MNLELFIWNYALFILAIFWGPRADDMGTEGRGVEGRESRVEGRGSRIRVEDRGSRNTNTLKHQLSMIIVN